MNDKHTRRKTEERGNSSRPNKTTAPPSECIGPQYVKYPTTKGAMKYIENGFEKSI